VHRVPDCIFERVIPPTEWQHAPKAERDSVKI